MLIFLGHVSVPMYQNILRNTQKLLETHRDVLTEV